MDLNYLVASLVSRLKIPGQMMPSHGAILTAQCKRGEMMNTCVILGIILRYITKIVLQGVVHFLLLFMIMPRKRKCYHKIS